MDYERPIASGRLRYEKAGEPTGTYESWRYSSALEEYTILRIDMDIRDIECKEILLAHFILDPAKEIERAKFRHFGPGKEIRGDIQRDNSGFTISRRFIDQAQQKEWRKVDELPYKPGLLLIMPSIICLSLAATAVNNGDSVSIVVLDRKDFFEKHEDTGKVIRAEEAKWESHWQSIDVTPYSIMSSSSESKLWLDKYGWPIMASLSDEQTAVETAYWRFQQNPKR